MYIMTHNAPPFNTMSRIGNDECDMSQRNIQNAQAATYILDNYNTTCPMNNAISLATSQPNINYSGSHQVGIGGCNIDDSSHLSHSIQAKQKCRIDLFERPYITVPYLGKGNVDPIIESKLQQGENETTKKSVNPYSEISYAPYIETPMIPSLKNTISNPTNLVESSASRGWIRGGVPSRELTRDNTCYNNSN